MSLLTTSAASIHQLGAARYERYFKIMRPLNLAFVAGAIGFTPSVNFNILKSYRPGTLYRLLT